MKFALLASGSKGNAFLLQDENEILLIDCGTTRKYLTSCLSNEGVKIEDIDAVLITHDHTDHVSQIRMFKDRPVYAPVDLAVPVHKVHAEEPFLLGHLTIRPLALSHDAVSTTGYVIESASEKLVYITDTGYVKDAYIPYLENADYIILESNHDVGQLMHTARPMYVKTRIASDEGHLCNEDCALLLSRILSPRTRMAVLAHISQEANTREQALRVNARQIFQDHKGRLHPDFVLCAAGQFETIRGGEQHETTDLGTCFCTAGMEQRADVCPCETAGIRTGRA